MTDIPQAVQTMRGAKVGIRCAHTRSHSRVDTLTPLSNHSIREIETELVCPGGRPRRALFCAIAARPGSASKQRCFRPCARPLPSALIFIVICGRSRRTPLPLHANLSGTGSFHCCLQWPILILQANSARAGRIRQDHALGVGPNAHRLATRAIEILKPQRRQSGRTRPLPKISGW
jgi:hypothetical protein